MGNSRLCNLYLTLRGVCFVAFIYPDMSDKCSRGTIFGCFIHLAHNMHPKAQTGRLSYFHTLGRLLCCKRQIYLNIPRCKNEKLLLKPDRVSQKCETRHVCANKRKRKIGFRFPKTQYFSKISTAQKLH